MIQASSAKPQATSPQKVNAWLMLQRALQLIQQAAPVEFRGLILSAIPLALLPSAMGFVAKLILDQLALKISDHQTQVLYLLGLEAGMALLLAILASLMDVLRAVLRDRVQQHLRLRVAEQAAQLDLEFYERPGHYDAFARARQELGFRPFLMAFALITAFTAFVKALGFLITVAITHPLMAVLLLLAAIPSFILTGRSGQQVYTAQDLLTPEARRASYFEGLLTSDQAAKEVRLNGLSKYLLNEFKLHLSSIFLINQRLNYSRGRNSSLSDVIAVAAQYFALAIALLQAVQQRLSVGDYVLLTLALAGVRSGMTMFLSNLAEFKTHSLFFTDLERFLALKPQLQTPMAQRKAPRVIQQGFVLENIDFTYPGTNQPVIQGLNLELRANQVTALVGLNGAGKTTLVKLLTRLYDPTAGRILLDGVDLREFDLQTYRQRLGVVWQDFNRFHVSFKENIIFGQPDDPLNLEKLNQSLQDAELEAILNGLPEGLDTQLGRQFHVRGHELSGGQWQRLALARALYKDAPILILDEPSSALDPQAETALFARYREITQQRLSLLITHRFNTVQMADRIVVLGQGKVVEDDSHRNLLKLDGHYANLFNQQAKSYL
jgi:ATP-binding cassette, subfamily B, bacterial